jgi:tRNA (guanosine-2'-O-)-methyltransferase
MTPQRFAKLKACLARRQPDLSVLMDNVHKEHNLSAVVRTCDAVGIGRVHAVSPQGAVRKFNLMAAGSSKWVNTQIHPDLVTATETLHKQGHQILAAHFSDRARDFREFDYTRPTTILLGSELHGVSEEGAELADEHILIPMAGMVASLNVSVAAAVILFEAQRQRAVAGMYDVNRLDAAEYERQLFEWCYPEIARQCRQHGQAYPALDEDGYLINDGALGSA